VPILLNTSLGSFIYQTALETFMLLLIIPGLAFAALRPARRGSRRMTRKVAPAPRSPSATTGRRPVSLRS
jgi:hypothetical protein